MTYTSAQTAGFTLSLFTHDDFWYYSFSLFLIHPNDVYGIMRLIARRYTKYLLDRHENVRSAQYREIDTDDLNKINLIKSASFGEIKFNA